MSATPPNINTRNENRNPQADELAGVTDPLCEHLHHTPGSSHKQCGISVARRLLQQVGDKPREDQQRIEALRNVTTLIDANPDPQNFIYQACRGDKSLLDMAISPCCKDTILYDLLRKSISLGIGAAELQCLNHAIGSILRDETYLHLEQNRLNNRALSKLAKLALAATPAGVQPDKWVLLILNAASEDDKVTMLAFLGLVGVIVVLFFEDRRCHRYIGKRSFWGDVLCILWQHPRVAQGTMSGVIKVTLKLLEREQNLWHEESQADAKISERTPWYIHREFDMVMVDFELMTTTLEQFLRSPPLEVPAANYTHDDVDILLRQKVAARKVTAQDIFDIREENLNLLRTRVIPASIMNKSKPLKD